MLVKELQSLALNIRVLDADGEEIELSQLNEEEPPVASMSTLEEVEAAVDAEAAGEDLSDEDYDDEDYDDEELDEDEYVDGEDDDDYSL